MNELFQITESKSPRLLWMEKHGVLTSTATDCAYDPPLVTNHASATVIFVGKGETKDAAIVDLAKRMGIPLWNEEGAV